MLESPGMMTPPDGGDPSLTPLEREVLAVSATGLTTAEVADRLGLATSDVRRALASAVAKLGARSRLEAVIIAVRRGLIDLPEP